MIDSLHFVEHAHTAKIWTSRVYNFHSENLSYSDFYISFCKMSIIVAVLLSIVVPVKQRFTAAQHTMNSLLVGFNSNYYCILTEFRTKQLYNILKGIHYQIMFLN